MFKYLIFTLTIGILGCTFSQNLIPNGSFEENSSCPDNISQLEKAQPWKSVSIYTTPDYFNACGISPNITVPSNYNGYQQAQDGNGYAGIYCYTSFGSEYREYIYIKISEELKSNVCYTISFYLNLSDNSNGYLDQFGIGFSNSQPLDPNGFHFVPEFEILANGNFEDSNNWITVSESYVAQGGEKYLILGCFEDDLNIKLLVKNPGQDSTCYYYVDNVKMTECSEVNSGEMLGIPNVFTPNVDGVNDYIDFSIFEKVVLINRWGVTVVVMGSQSNFKWYGKNFREEDLPDGVYYYIADLSGIKYTGSIYLIR
ncbi:MAG: gliding motility-associated C-terminal domain-containing protein [Crocinitomicaceae bacterium]